MFWCLQSFFTSPFPTNWEEFPVRKAWSGSNDFTIRTLDYELEGTRHGSHSPPWLPRRMVHPHVAFKEIRSKRGKRRQRSNRCRSWTMESGNLERIPDGIWNSWSSHGKEGGCTDACSEIHSYYGRSLLGPVWNWQLQEKTSCWDDRCCLHVLDVFYIDLFITIVNSLSDLYSAPQIQRRTHVTTRPLLSGLHMHGHKNGLKTLLKLGPILWSGADDGCIRHDGHLVGSLFFFLYRRQAVALRWWRMHRNCGGVDSIPWGFHFQASYYWLPHVNSVDFYHGWGMGIYWFTFYFGILSGMSEMVANNQWHDVRVDWCKWSAKGVYFAKSFDVQRVVPAKV